MIRITSLLILAFALGFIWSFSKPVAAPISRAFPEELPGPFTGGFSEESCHSCHFDYPLNSDKGSLTIEGIPEQYQAEKSYNIKISVNRKNIGKAGFQLSSRFEDSSQAGLIKTNSERLSFTETESKVQYLQHSADGVKPQTSDSTYWNFTWIAPDSAGNAVIINLAANAGNGDASAFGDYIFTKEIRINGKEE